MLGHPVPSNPTESEKLVLFAAGIVLELFGKADRKKVVQPLIRALDDFATDSSGHTFDFGGKYYQLGRNLALEAWTKT